MIRKIQSIFSTALKLEVRAGETVTEVDQSSSVEHRIKAIMAEVFKISINHIDEATTADNLDQWTSIEHVDFLVKLQKEFEIEFTDSQIVEMLSYKTVVANVTAALAAKKET